MSLARIQIKVLCRASEHGELKLSDAYSHRTLPCRTASVVKSHENEAFSWDLIAVRHRTVPESLLCDYVRYSASTTTPFFRMMFAYSADSPDMITAQDFSRVRS